MDDNENYNNYNNYKKVTSYSSDSSSSNASFVRNFFLPFISGVLGATLTIGVCFGVSDIKQKLLGNSYTAPVSTDSISTATPNNNLISLSNYSDTGVSVAEKIQPSVVGIKVEYTVNSIFSMQSTASAEGSGVIISKDGYILTNNHIVNTSSSSSYYQLSEATKLTVYLYGDDTEYEAKIVGTDSLTDLAVIKIEKNDLTPAILGDSDGVRVGEFVMAAGNPLGMQNSITSGIVSAVEREVTDTDGKKFTLIQTDAAINSGNSGGALVNSKGEVIGINTLKLSGTGIEGMGFAIPINDTKDIADQLIQYNKVKRPYIGISGLDLDEKTAKQYNYPVGIYIRSIDDFSAAQKAGLRAGDVIIEADSKAVKTMDELNSIKNTHKIGDEMTLKVSRDGKEISVTLTLTEQP